VQKQLTRPQSLPEQGKTNGSQKSAGKIHPLNKNPSSLDLQPAIIISLSNFN